MSEKGSNRQVLENIAKKILQLKTQEEIDAFVNMYVYSVLVA
ncbi:MAG: hypothetical protein ACOWWH_03565 [Eubacteriaceae bacterium]